MEATLLQGDPAEDLPAFVGTDGSICKRLKSLVLSRWKLIDPDKNSVCRATHGAADRGYGQWIKIAVGSVAKGILSQARVVAPLGPMTQKNAPMVSTFAKACVSTACDMRDMPALVNRFRIES